MKTATLHDVVGSDGVFTDGDWVESKDQDPNGDVRLIQLADVGVGAFLDKSARFLTSKRARELGCTYLEPGDLLISRMPDPIGRACIFPGDLGQRCATVVDVSIVRPDKRRVDGSYLKHLLNSAAFRRGIDRFVQGSTRQRISRSNLGQIEFALPDLSEQRRIAAVLDAADALRAKRRAALAKLDTLAQSIFVETFHSELSHGERTPLGELVTEFRYGTSVKSEPTGAPVLRIPNVIGGQIDVSDLKFVPLERAELNRLRLEDGDVLFVRTNGNPNYVGRCAVFEERLLPDLADRDSPWVYASYLIRARLASDRLEPLFLREFLHHSTGQKALRERAKTSAGQYNINVEALSSILLPTPKIEKQRQFRARLLHLEPMKVALDVGLRKQDSLFKSLQTAAFSGELSYAG